MTEERNYLEETDDGRRATEEVVVCLADLGNGQSRLIFDDVVITPDPRQRSWRHKSFYTSNAYANEPLDNISLSDEQFQQIGIALVARLLAINGRVVPDPA